MLSVACVPVVEFCSCAASNIVDFCSLQVQVVGFAFGLYVGSRASAETFPAYIIISSDKNGLSLQCG